MIELKAVTALQDIHLAQAKNYVVAYGFDIGLLINFGGNKPRNGNGYSTTKNRE